jgi:hypothetical protein
MFRIGAPVGDSEVLQLNEKTLMKSGSSVGCNGVSRGVCHTTEAGTAFRTGPGAVLGTFAGGGDDARDGASTGRLATELACGMTVPRLAGARAAVELEGTGRVTDEASVCEGASDLDDPGAILFVPTAVNRLATV